MTKLNSLLVVVLFFVASCSSFSELNFKIDTTSPQKTYRVIVEGRPDPPGVLSTAQQVRLQVLRGEKVLFTDENFYREEVDHSFAAEYPVHEWLNDSVLRFRKANSANAVKEKVTIVNNTGDRIDFAKIEYSILNEKFLVLDFGAGQRAELDLIPGSDGARDPNPLLLCTAYLNGKQFTGIVTHWRSEGSQLVGELIKS